MNKESKNDYMKLQDQVCTLEQSKRLEELGIEYDDAPILHYMIIGNEDYLWLVGHNDQTGDALESYPAFTVAELGLILPDNHLSIRTTIGEAIGWEYFKNGSLMPMADVETEAECRAAMLIYLLENKLTTPEECNKRLTT